MLYTGRLPWENSGVLPDSQCLQKVSDQPGPQGMVCSLIVASWRVSNTQEMHLEADL